MATSPTLQTRAVRFAAHLGLPFGGLMLIYRNVEEYRQVANVRGATCFDGTLVLQLGLCTFYLEEFAYSDRLFHVYRPLFLA